MSLSDRVLRCLQPLLRLVEGPGDTEDDRIRKTLLIPAFLVSALYAVSYVAKDLQREAYMQAATHGIALLTYTSFLCYVFITKRCSEVPAGAAVVLGGGIYVAADIWTYGVIDNYTGGVLVIDTLLVCKCPDSFVRYTYVMWMTVIAVSTTEQTLGALGIFDAIPESWTGFQRPAKKKGDNIFVNLLVQRLTVFTLDFLMTRYFSKGVRMQRERVERSVVVAQRIAFALARFDLDKAEEMVEMSEGLPLELLDAFTCLLGNLRSYKPYLPQSCLPSEVEDEEVIEESRHEEESSGTGSSPWASVHTADLASMVTRKAATVVQANIRNFMGVAGEMGTTGMAEFHDGYIAHIVDASKSTKGLVEHFVCDRVLVSFNAAKSCASHRMQGLMFMKKVQTFTTAAGCSLSMAATSGEVMCGSLGCDGLRGYSLVGLAAAWVPLLERLAVQLTVSTLADSTISSHARGYCFFRLLGRARFDKHQAKELFVYEFLGLREQEEAEWMYQLEAPDPWRVYNNAMLRLLDGKYTEALKLAENFPHDGLHTALRDTIEEESRTRKEGCRSSWVIRDIGFADVEVVEAGDTDAAP